MFAAMNRTTVIQNLIDTHGLTSYLEIGVQHGENYDAIVCKYKYGIDPNSNRIDVFKMTSDAFFDLNAKLSFDIVFIDGLHHAEQVERDIINSFKCGARFIVVHDCNPTSLLTQTVPRISKEWYGDVWRAFVGFKQLVEKHYPDYFKIHTHDLDCGVGVIEILQNVTEIKWEPNFSTKIPYSQFDLNRKQLLNLI